MDLTTHRPNGNILVDVKHDSFGHIIAMNYRWVGGPVIRISRVMLPHLFSGEPTVGQLIDIGPYRVMIVSIRFDGQDVICVRYMNGWRTIRASVKLFRHLDSFYRRTIVALSIYGLASVQPYRVPSWEDVPWLKRQVMRTNRFRMESMKRFRSVMWWLLWVQARQRKQQIWKSYKNN